MRVTHIALSAYRNYARLELPIHANLCVFVGNNAQGKTNLLESLYYLATARSFRAIRDEDLIQWGQSEASASCTVQREVGEAVIRVRISRNRPKSLTVNGQTLRRHADLLGYLNVVTFSPDDLQLVKGSPAERRRFLDVELAQVNPTYRHDLTAYYRILRQRNNLLKQMNERKGSADLLDAWNQQLLDIGSRLIAKRAEATLRLSAFGQFVHSDITAGTEKLAIRYRPFFAQPGEVPVEEGAWESLSVVRNRFQREMERLRTPEILRGQTLVGPQRDDLEFCIDERDARTFGSQGQQRTAVLSCKLAEIEFMRSETGEYPVLLLDDVMSELDESRRHYFLSTVSGRVQTFITTTSQYSFPPEFLTQAQMARVVAGKVHTEQA